MAKCRVIPVEVEAFQITEESMQDQSSWPWWVHDAWSKDYRYHGALWLAPPGKDGKQVLCISNIGSYTEIRMNDWIVRDTKGEIHPCGPTVFANTYEAVAEEETN